MLRGRTAVITEKMNDPRGMMKPGDTFQVEGPASEVFGMPWDQAQHHMNWAAIHYGTRSRRNSLPDDNDVYYGKVDGMGHVLHRSEFEYTS